MFRLTIGLNKSAKVYLLEKPEYTGEKHMLKVQCTLNH